MTISAEQTDILGQEENRESCEPNSGGPHKCGRASSLCDWGVLLAYAAVVALAIVHHELWADEAQAWVMARDLSFGKMLAEMHFEGSPALWHTLLWIGIHGFHLPYSALSWLGFAGAVSGAAVLLFCAPFPRPLRYAMVFSFFLVYQYAVIARPYTLVPLLAFSGVYLYRKQARPILMAVFLVLLANLSLFSAIIAGAIAAAYFWKLVAQWRSLDPAHRTRHMVALSTMFVGFALVVVTAYPSPDARALAHFGLREGLQRTLIGTNGALTSSLSASIVLLVLLVIWAYRRREFLLFVLGVGGTTTFLAWGYGATHHVGMITIAMMVTLWAGWPLTKKVSNGKQDLRSLFPIALVAIVCAVQISWSVVSIYKDWKFPYTGAADAAKFLESVHADRQGVNACDLGGVAIQPYFPRNIFHNWPTANGAAFYHNSRFIRLEARSQCLLDKPFYVVVVDWEGVNRPAYEQSMASFGYSLVHYSPGQLYFKTKTELYQNYLIFRRNQ